MNDKEQIQDFIKQGLLTIKEMGKFNTRTQAGKNTKKLIAQIKALSPMIQNTYPIISEILSAAVSKLNDGGIINAFAFGDARTSLKILKDIYCRPPKIFISHKSEDEAFVKALVELLRLYIGSDSEKIFCSSVPNYKIGIGKAIYP